MPNDPLAPPDNPFAPIHRPQTKPADYLNELLRDPEILRQTIEQAGNFAFGAGTAFERRAPRIGGPGSLSGLSRAMQVPTRFIAPQGQRVAILKKLMANEDFEPIINWELGRLHWRSLTPEENLEMQNIGWSRSPDVTYEMENAPESSREAWEKNLRYWLNLASPK